MLKIEFLLTYQRYNLLSRIDLFGLDPGFYKRNLIYPLFNNQYNSDMVELSLLSQNSPSDTNSLAEDGAPNSAIVMDSPIEETQLNMNTQTQFSEQSRQFGYPFYYWYNLLWSMMWQYRLGRSASGTGAQINYQLRSTTTSNMIDMDVEVGSIQLNDETLLPMTTDRTPESENNTKILSERQQKIVDKLKTIRDFLIISKMILSSLSLVNPWLYHGAGHLYYVAWML